MNDPVEDVVDVWLDELAEGRPLAPEARARLDAAALADPGLAAEVALIERLVRAREAALTAADHARVETQVAEALRALASPPPLAFPDEEDGPTAPTMRLPQPTRGVPVGRRWLERLAWGGAGLAAGAALVALALAPRWLPVEVDADRFQSAPVVEVGPPSAEARAFEAAVAAESAGDLVEARRRYRRVAEAARSDTLVALAAVAAARIGRQLDDPEGARADLARVPESERARFAPLVDGLRLAIEAGDAASP